MSFSRLFSNKSVNCLQSCLRNKQNINLSLNVKYFHSIKSLNSNSLKTHKLLLKTNKSHRLLSTLPTDTVIDFKPEKVIDLSDNINIELGQTLETLVGTGDGPITALGLGSNWTPIGWALHLLEQLHHMLPWFATIASATLILRTFMFPLVIKAQRNAVKMNAILPKMQELQQKATNARLSGNQMEFTKYTLDVQKLMSENGVSPFKSMLVPLVQAPVFLSFFLTLRRMAQLPVQSLKTGGILWFVDLTVPDPFHILPIITCATLWAALELGVESGVNANQSVFVKTFMRVIPAITLLFIWNFESAILMYWCSSNFISLLQVALLKQKTIRKWLNLPQPVKYKPPESQKDKGFYKTLKESMDNSKVYKKLEDRKRIDEINFKKAAIGPIKKTYKYDPTKVGKQQ